MENIKNCRSCGSASLTSVFSLGEQKSSGFFPDPLEDVDIPYGNLDLVLCGECGLVQLESTLPIESMYGERYGYRSSLNSSMRAHLESAARLAVKRNPVFKGPIVDVGSNDGTLLNSLVGSGRKLIGIDPLSETMSSSYDSSILRVPDFFSPEAFWLRSAEPAGFVFSFSMFYDLENPLEFAKNIREIMDDGATWVLEQSYLRSMLRNFSFDTICHEHVEYYSMRSLRWIMREAGLVITKVVMNDVNGGSIQLTVRKDLSGEVEDMIVPWLAQQEEKEGLFRQENWLAWGKDVSSRLDQIREFLESCKKTGRSVFGLGASTKGNVLLQAAGITKELLPAIGEVNTNKLGKRTPGSDIPIVAEEEILNNSPDFLLVLPWHFRPMLVNKFKIKISEGTRLVLPLPNLEIIG